MLYTGACFGRAIKGDFTKIVVSKIFLVRGVRVRVCCFVLGRSRACQDARSILYMFK